MKVILQKDVKGTGKAGDVCEVNDGYARNFLIPRKLALPGDASSINAANIKSRPMRTALRCSASAPRSLPPA